MKPEEKIPPDRSNLFISHSNVKAREVGKSHHVKQSNLSNQEGIHRITFYDVIEVIAIVIVSIGTLGLVSVALAYIFLGIDIVGIGGW